MGSEMCIRDRGMQQVVYGICLVYTGGTPIGSLNKDFTSLASNTILGVPVLIVIALFVACCFWFLYNKTRHGKYMYACLLYTSDAADEEDRGDIGGRRIIKKKTRSTVTR